MLHGDGADINLVVRQIINLDTRAVRIKKNVVQRADKILENTKNAIKANEKKVLDDVQELAKQNFQSEITKAKEDCQSIINSMDQELAKIRCRYDEKKDEKALEVLEKLFKQSKKQT